jgi:probable poly-beta-1,6-N-acetyl-D-glucosamine export protein
VTSRLLYLNGLAALGAVMNHASGWGFTAMFWWTNRYRSVDVPNFDELGSAAYYTLRGVEQAIVYSIPAFLFVSGFFVAFASGRDRSGPSPRVLWSRIKGLLVPYLIWSTVLLVIEAGQTGVYDPLRYLERLATGRIVEPYYYIPLLVQLLLMSPLIVWGVRFHWKATLTIAILIRAAVTLARYPVSLGWEFPATTWIYLHTPGWFFPRGMPWFVLGVFGGIHLDTFKGWLRRLRPALPWLALGLGAVAFVEWEAIFRLSGRAWIPPRITMMDALYAGAAVLAYLAYDTLHLPLARHISELGARSFGVYLLHAPVQEFVSRTTYHVAPGLLAHQLPFQLLLIASGLAVPIAAMKLVNRTPAKKYYTYLFG